MPSSRSRKMRLSRAAVLAAIIVLVALATVTVRTVSPVANAQQSDLPQGDTQWPTYMHDRYRSGITTAPLRLPLALRWVYQAPGPPTPAWPDPPPRPVEGLLERPKLKFDDAYQVAVVGGRIYFGTTEDNKVYCLDASSGKVIWSYFTEGPVRLAPTVSEGRVYVGSDDGCVYCLDAASGRLVWKFNAAPEPTRILGRGKMCSMWPVRTGVLVDRGVAYFGAGIFPAERVFIYAVDAATGALVWKNDTVGFESGSGARGGFTPQGYLLASNEFLFFPSGRALPACFSRADGRFLYQRGLSFRTWGVVGGCFALIADDRLISGATEMVEFDVKTGTAKFAWYEGKRLLVTKRVSYMLNDNGITALDRINYPRLQNEKKAIAQKRAALKRQKPKDLDRQLAALDEQEKRVVEELKKCVLWRVERKGLEHMIIAANLLIAGGDGEVVAIDRNTGRVVWTWHVDGVAKGLAVADGRLVVSTTTGAIYTFATGAATARIIAPPANPNPYPRDATAEAYATAARAIVALSGVTKGYCLVLNAGEGRLALELAKRTQLRIYGAEADEAKVAAARKALDAASLYGRACIDHVTSSTLPYSDYFANLVVCDAAVLGNSVPASAKEAWRCLKPCGGVMLIGSPRATVSEAKLRAWLASAGIRDFQIIRRSGLWAKVVRGEIPGSDWWTHQYCTPGNVASSEDKNVRLPLGVLWYGDPGPAFVPSRHARNVAPLAINGRVFLQGFSKICCFDAYNGYIYWVRDVPGAYRTGASHEASNLALRADSLFVATGAKCLRLSTETGGTMATFELPPETNADGKHKWAYVAVVGDTLVGSAQIKRQFSDAVFAYDIPSGKLKWVRKVVNARDTAMAIDGGRLFIVEKRPVTDEQRRAACAPRIAELKKRLKITDQQAEDEIKKADVRWAVAIDLDSGKTAWEKPVDITKCYDVGRGGGALLLMAHHGALVFTGTHGDGHYWSDFLGGAYVERRALVLSQKDGSLLWTKPIGCRIKPLIVGDTLYAEPWAFDLHTGRQKMRTHPYTGKPTVWEMERPGHHCGPIVGCPNTLFFRSWSTAYYDLVADHGTEHFGGQRTGCWVNTLPVGGLMVEPEASSGCQCLHAFQVTLVFKTRSNGVRRTWGIFCSRGEYMPIKTLRVNLGAPGDRRDSSGRLWLGYPRPWGRMRIDVPMKVNATSGAGYFTHPAEYVKAPGAQVPWLFASGHRGNAEYSFILFNPEDGAALYTVRLGFMDNENTAAGQRVFDIKIQDKTVAASFDPVAAAGPGKPVVKEFRGVRVDSGKLTIALATKVAKPKDNQLPLVNFIEIVRERVLGVGMAAPPVTLSDLDREKAIEVKMANRTERAFTGRLVISAPGFVSVSPTFAPIKLGQDEKTSVKLTVRVAHPSRAGKYQIRLRLVDAAGRLETERLVPLDYLGARGRLVVPASEDTYVIARSPSQNFGSAPTLSVDGGAQAMRDKDWSIAYMKFRFHVPGRVASVKLRLHVATDQWADSGGAGTVRLVEGAWDEKTLTFNNRPALGKELAKIGRVQRGQVVELPLQIDLEGKTEISLAIDPTTTDGTGYVSREGGKPPELIIEYAK